ncbi:MAG: putative alpha/beta superfamily hydrolase, partial [Paraglaciecola sp.]
MSGFRVNATLVLSALINKPKMINAYFVTSPQLRDNFAGILSTAGSKLKRLNNKPRFLYFTQGNSIKEESQQESYNK